MTNCVPHLLVLYYVALSTVALLTLLDAARLPWALRLLKELTEHGKRYRPGATLATSTRWGLVSAVSFLLKLRIPKTWFAHFYAVGLVTTSAAVYCSSPFQSCIMLYLFILHLARRLYECSFVHAFGDSTMSSAAYIMGLLHYIILPLALSDFSTFNFIVLDADSGGSVTSTGSSPNLRVKLVQQPSDYDDDEDSRGRVKGLNPNRLSLEMLTNNNPSVLLVLGLILFVASNIGQHVAHRHLAAMRGGGANANATKNEARGSQGTHTLNPEKHSALFFYSTCPHYSFEIALYIGMMAADYPAVLAGKERAATAAVRAAIVLFVAANLGVSATTTHHWYAEQRKKTGLKGGGAKWIIIPFIY